MSYHHHIPWLSNARAIAPPAQPGGTKSSPDMRRHLRHVYDYMACGLAMTGIVADLVTSTGFHAAMMDRMPLLLPFFWLFLLAPLALVMLFWLDIDAMSFFAAQAVFWIHAAYAGFSLGCISLVYTGTSIAPASFLAAGAFAAMSLCSYVTRTDLSTSGNLLAMGLVGAALAGVMNVFLASTPVELAVSVAVVIALVGLTAWDMQHIKEFHGESNGDGVMNTALIGALALFIDANPVALLLRLESRRRDYL